MSLEEAASMQSRIVFWIEELELCLHIDGAKTSMSRWRRSHQKKAFFDNGQAVGRGDNYGTYDRCLKVAEG